MEELELIALIAMLFYLFRFIYCWIMTEIVIYKIKKTRENNPNIDLTYALLKWETKILESTIMLHRWDQRSITQFLDDKEWEIINHA